MNRGYKLAAESIDSLLASLREVWAYIAELHGANPERAAEIVEQVSRDHSGDEPGSESARRIARHVRYIAMCERDGVEPLS